MKSKALNIFVTAILLLTMLGSVSAQAQTPQPNAPVTSPSAQQQTEAQSDVAPIYGLQGVLIETVDGKSVSAQSVDQA
jgi:hypothetical protein